MDQRAGEEEERNSEDSSDHRRKDDVDAAAEGPGMNNHGKSMDLQRDSGGSCSAPAPAAAADDVPAAAAADSPQEGDQEGGGDKAASEVGTQVRAVRRPQPPGRPREGPGGDGGNHH